MYTNGMASPSRPRAVSPGAPAAIAAILTAILATAGCDLPPSFGPEYEDPTLNFIAALPLEAPPAAGDASGLDAPAVWDWAWRGDGPLRAGNAYQYMSLLDAGAVGTAVVSGAYTLAATAGTWRMELVNLFELGDFETFAEGSTAIPGMDHKAGASIGIVEEPDALAIHGKSVFLSSNNNARLFTIFDFADPAAGLADASDASITNGKYSFMATTLSAPPTLRFLVSDPLSAEMDDGYYCSVDNDRFLVRDITGLAIAAPFLLGSASSYQFSMDDIRVARTDIDPGLVLRLRPGDSSPGLVTGYYEFSLWARIPDDAKSDADDGRTDESYPARSVTLVMLQVGFLDDSTEAMQVKASFATSSAWTRLALRMPEGSNLHRFDEASDETVLELYAYPAADPNDPEPGVVLISSPELRFFMNGY